MVGMVELAKIRRYSARLSRKLVFFVQHIDRKKRSFTGEKLEMVFICYILLPDTRN